MRRCALALVLVVLAFGGSARATGEPATRVLFLRSISPRQALTLYERVLGLGPVTRITAGKAVGSIVVRDTRDRLMRFDELLADLDHPTGDRHRIYARPVIHRSPSEILALAREAWDAAGRGPVRMAADDRSWLLVVRATADTYAVLDKLLRRLDVRPGAPR